ncbi:MAG: tetratricopeptide repeat protein [Nitrospira sp.]|nr:tetratricopeptide repeat protein [Nitrospira sp.]
MPPNAEAIDKLALTVAREPGSKAFLALAEEYGKAGMWQEAAAILEDGLRHSPGFITAMVTLGRAYEQLGQFVKAIAILEEAVRLSPENLRAHRILAKIYAAQGQKEAAVRSCRAILTVNPKDQEALSICSALGLSPAELDADRLAGRMARGAGRPIAEPVVQAPARVSTADVFELQDADSAGRTMFAEQRKQRIVAQLAQWLTSIQQRRRDRNFLSTKLDNGVELTRGKESGTVPVI